MFLGLALSPVFSRFCLVLSMLVVGCGLCGVWFVWGLSQFEGGGSRGGVCVVGLFGWGCGWLLFDGWGCWIAGGGVLVRVVVVWWLLAWFALGWLVGRWFPWWLVGVARWLSPGVVLLVGCDVLRVGLVGLRGRLVFGSRWRGSCRGGWRAVDVGGGWRFQLA